MNCPHDGSSSITPILIVSLMRSDFTSTVVSSRLACLEALKSMNHTVSLCSSVSRNCEVSFVMLPWCLFIGSEGIQYGTMVTFGINEVVTQQF